MNCPAISVIIPVYNQEKYIGRCIRSVLKQSFQNFEVILVNDGSIDKSLKICKKYAQKDKKIIIVDKRNEGVTLARKDGLLKAQGEFVCFVDGDDYLGLKAFELLYNISKESSADMVIGAYDIVWDNWGFVKKNVQLTDKYYNRLINKQELLPLMMGLGGEKSYPWGIYVFGRFYRRDIIMRAYESCYNYLFPSEKGYVSEDDSFNMAITSSLQSIWITNNIVYHYRYGGVTTRDYPVIRKGGGLYDDRFDECVKLNQEIVFPEILERYVKHLLWDVKNQIHYNVCPTQQIIEFIHCELNERKIVQWSKHHFCELPEKIQENALIQSVLNDKVETFFDLARKRELFLRKHHYWKMRLLKYYQNVVDRVGKMVDWIY